PWYADRIAAARRPVAALGMAAMAALVDESFLEWSHSRRARLRSPCRTALPARRHHVNINVTAEEKAEAEIGPAPFEVERLGAKLGAEIHGLDLKQPMGPRTFKAFESALIEHKVIVVRDQHLTTEEHVKMSRMFGELEVHPMRPQGEFPEILVLDNH